MRLSISKTTVAAAALGILGASAVLAASSAVDLGAVKDSTISVTVALRLSDLAGAEAMMQRLATPGDPMYLKFLTPAQAQAQFGPNEADVQRVIATLGTAGLTAVRATSTTL